MLLSCPKDGPRTPAMQRFELRGRVALHDFNLINLGPLTQIFTSRMNHTIN